MSQKLQQRTGGMMSVGMGQLRVRMLKSSQLMPADGLCPAMACRMVQYAPALPVRMVRFRSKSEVPGNRVAFASAVDPHRERQSVRTRSCCRVVTAATGSRDARTIA